MTFFSSTDTATLREEGSCRNNFVSLIVNNAGTYTAAITRRVKSKQVKKSVSYEFFGEGERSETKEYTGNEEEIEWFYLSIEKEGEYSFPNIETRLKEIKEKKKEEAKQATILPTAVSPAEFKTIIPKTVNTNTGNNIFENSKTLQAGTEGNLFYPNDDTINYEAITVNEDVIDSLVKQLITCSIIIPNNSKVDIDKWIKSMPSLYKNRFGKGEIGMKNFKDWADLYTEFITWNIEDKDLVHEGYDQTEIQSIYAYYLIRALSALPENNYIKAYIDELERYLFL